MNHIGNVIERFEVTTSTNSLLKARAELGLAKHGTVIWADHQTAGRGRMDRVWEADPGKGLLFSTLLLPDSSLSRITLIGLLASLAVYESISEELTKSVSFYKSQLSLLRLKWPNDILYDNRKLCGILCESGVNSNDKDRFIVLGVGVNINQNSDDFSKEIRNIATSMSEISGQKLDREKFLHSILSQLDRYYNKVINQGDGWIVDEWLRCSTVLGKRVSVKQREQKLEGICQGLQADGAIKLMLESGETITIYSGDTSI